MPKGVYIRNKETIEKLRVTRSNYQAMRTARSLITKKCHYCNKDFAAREKLNRYFCSRSCKTKKQLENPSNHPMWRGENGNTSAIHRWIDKARGGRPQTCEWCKNSPERAADGRATIEWANLSGDYKRELSDWAALCQSCHRKYDYDRFRKRDRNSNGQFISFTSVFGDEDEWNK